MLQGFYFYYNTHLSKFTANALECFQFAAEGCN